MKLCLSSVLHFGIRKTCHSYLKHLWPPPWSMDKVSLCDLKLFISIITPTDAYPSLLNLKTYITWLHEWQKYFTDHSFKNIVKDGTTRYFKGWEINASQNISHKWEMSSECLQISLKKCIMNEQGRNLSKPICESFSTEHLRKQRLNENRKG